DHAPEMLFTDDRPPNADGSPLPPLPENTVVRHLQLGTTFLAPADTIYVSNGTAAALANGQEVVYDLQMDASGIGGLVRGQSYWVIKLTDHALKVAASYANAMAGIAVPLTSPGTGIGTNYYLTSTDGKTRALFDGRNSVTVSVVPALSEGHDEIVFDSDH